MPDTRTHRGLHPRDAVLFAGEIQPTRRAAAGDLSWLLERGYALQSSLKLVGDRYALEQRQRDAVGLSACAPTVVRGRDGRRSPLHPFDLTLYLTMLDSGSG